MKNTTDLETVEQERVVEHLKELLDKGDILNFSALPLSTYTKSWSQKRKNKSQGVRKGVPDLLVIHKNGQLYIELKRKKGGNTSTEQKRWIAQLNETGAIAVVCKGSDEAIAVINEVVSCEYEHYEVETFTDYLLKKQNKWKV